MDQAQGQSTSHQPALQWPAEGNARVPYRVFSDPGIYREERGRANRKRKRPGVSALPASDAAWIKLNDLVPSERTPQSSPSTYACLAGSEETAEAIAG